ncbi:riboflavin synthase [Candidatus Lucifugimonas marina]|jgi:riboflavin synthase|uniref:Riboflavin synthase n=1 Tax=Candidatus Lucifugimonas marina TaxID=3038979 RepID=A0AAJ5ZGK7_9CHLR|nr:riboflavin synthase [SAR202 cluster bacterium JH702]MDG0869123.1 riboflavin synthase [SAR202 cluster bacterium JH639]WFG35743.1 riboflavin synthase [SAR202 cluster bacterium JH545]WFG39689.1 riboflavin synthase [SAR202 cluster bacterium JH1073]
MFSGIIEEVGTVESYDGETLVVRANQVLDDLKISESIMVAGACLTVTSLAQSDSTFTVETVPETRTRTNFGDLTPGSKVNLERSLRYGDRVGGHMVQGHVDGVGSVRSVIEDGNSRIIVIEAPENIIENVVEKGFITVDGTSLTVVDRNDDSFSIAIIPYTFDHTTLNERPEGSKVNLEADVTAKYVANLIEPYLNNLKK